MYAAAADGRRQITVFFLSLFREIDGNHLNSHMYVWQARQLSRRWQVISRYHARAGGERAPAKLLDSKHEIENKKGKKYIDCNRIADP